MLFAPRAAATMDDLSNPYGQAVVDRVLAATCTTVVCAVLGLIAAMVMEEFRGTTAPVEPPERDEDIDGEAIGPLARTGDMLSSHDPSARPQKHDETSSQKQKRVRREKQQKADELARSNAAFNAIGVLASELDELIRTTRITLSGSDAEVDRACLDSVGAKMRTLRTTIDQNTHKPKHGQKSVQARAEAVYAHAEKWLQQYRRTASARP